MGLGLYILFSLGVFFQIRAVTILDLYRQGKLDLSRVGLEEGKYTRADLVLTLTRVFLARVLFFPILPITMFLKVKYLTFNCLIKFLTSVTNPSNF